jgi:hypothetical protein
VPKALHISQGNNQQGLVLLSITLFFWLIIRPLDWKMDLFWNYNIITDY